jgi:hypothetical protein
MKIVRRLFSMLIIGATSLSAIAQKPALSNKSKFILRDEGLSQLCYVDLANPKSNWFVRVPAGRDIQLVGDGRVMIGTGSGYEEHDITTGKKIDSLTTFPGTFSARRLRNGHTLLAGINLAGKTGVVLVEVDGKGNPANTISFENLNYVRLVRETPSGTFLVTSDTIVFEANASNKILWKARIKSDKGPHCWQAVRLTNGQTIVAAGYGGNFQVFGTDGSLINSFNGPAEVNPVFYAGFQILKKGNYVVTNWQGHGPGHGNAGNQLLEYTPAGKLVWSWKQDPLKFSSLQGVIVLDGLDLKKLHVEDEHGILAPVR